MQIESYLKVESRLRKTLVVEDDPVIRALLVEVLQDSGRKVVSAENGRAALQHLRVYGASIGAIVTDQHLQAGLTGSDLIAHLRPSYPGMAMVLVTGDPGSVSEAWLKQHQVRLLSKPFDLGAVVEALRADTGYGGQARHGA